MSEDPLELSKQDLSQIRCNSCEQATHHTELSTYRHSWEDEAQHIDGWNKFFVLECGGCKSITVVEEVYFSEAWQLNYNFYPPRFRRPWSRITSNCPELVHESIRQTYHALNNDLLLLAMMGARAAIDAFIQDVVGDHCSFKAGLKAMKDKKHVSDEEESILGVAIEAGNAATHRGFIPDEEAVQHVLDVLERALNRHYEDPHELDNLKRSSARLERKIPRRNPPKTT